MAPKIPRNEGLKFDNDLSMKSHFSKVLNDFKTHCRALVYYKLWLEKGLDLWDEPHCEVKQNIQVMKEVKEQSIILREIALLKSKLVRFPSRFMILTNP